MKIILSDHSECFVDEEDFNKYGHLRWSNNSGYAYRSEFVDGIKKTIYLHRLIVNAPKGVEVDHINGNRLDNSRNNLRLCTHQQNMWNIRRQGIDFRRDRGKWRARIQVDGKQKYLGMFESKEEAKSVYDQAAKEIFGEYAYDN